MIYDLHTYSLKPGTAPEFEKRYGDALHHRLRYSKLGAFWHVEVGSPVDQVIHVWPYEDVNQWQQVRTASFKDPNWPPRIQEFSVHQEIEIVLPAPFMRPLEPCEMGAIYEMCTHTYPSGTMPEVLRLWGEAIERREKYSPMAACWSSGIGTLNRLIHIWPYRNFAEREKVQQAVQQDGIWPSRIMELLVRKDNKLLRPAAFSPLR